MLDLCPACLLVTALSIEEEPCPYQVLAPMSEDSGGVTYLAQGLTGGYVALKIHRRHADSDAVLSRYHHWKPVLANVQHPSIARLLDVGLTGEGLLYVATEYAAGWSLAAVAARASLGTPEQREIANQLTAAIDVAHAAGIVHLKLDASKVKLSTANGLHATILGFGSSLIVDDADGPPEADRLALKRILRDLGLEQ